MIHRTTPGQQLGPGRLLIVALVICSAPTALLAAEYRPAELAQATPMGPLDPDQVLHVHAVLGNPNRLQHERLLLELRQKGQVGFVDPQLYRSKFHPSPTAVQRAVDALAAYGMVLDGPSHGLFVPLRVTAGDLGRALQVTMQNYRTADGRTVVAPDAEPKLPADLPVESFSGLVQGMTQVRTFVRRLPTPPSTKNRSAASKAAQAGTPPTVNGVTIRRAYGVPDTARGSGQTVGLLAFDPVDPADLKLYGSTNGFSMPPVNYVKQPGGSSGLGGDATEWTLDMEMISTLAPNLAELRVYMLGDLLQALNEIANPTYTSKTLVRTISASFGVSGISGQDLDNFEKVLQQMVAQGQTLFVASGDSGSSDQTPTTMPGASPSVCAVGGTTLTADGQGSYVKEVGWSGSGGGPTGDFSRPAYQASLAQLAAPVSQTKRNIPDVALTADNVEMALQGQLTNVGGTSAAAPMWAGVMALVQEARAAAGAAPMGFINTTLYAMDSGDYAKTFHDIKQGSNGAYTATTGYDLVTGWGTPNVGALLSLWAGAGAATGTSGHGQTDGAGASGGATGSARAPFQLPPSLRR